MSNMSHCRFENTSNDLRDCLEALNIDGVENLSEYEHKAAKRLFKLCKNIVENYDEELDGN